jgi:uncharacterized membrane protein required for colicin V production
MVIDILLILFAIGAFWIGYTQGIVSTLLSVLTYIVALLLTLKFSPWLADLLVSTFKIGKLFALIFGTIGFFILISFLLRWLVKRADKYIQKSKLSSFSKIMGGVVMMLIGIMSYSFILIAINQFGMIGEQTRKTSYSFKTLEIIPSKAKDFIEEFKPLFRRYWELMEETAQESKNSPAG